MTKENKPEAHRLERQKRKPCYEVLYERLYNDPGNGLLTPAGYLYCLIKRIASGLICLVRSACSS
ncbi:hypothetical protein NDI45_27635 [Leptolyngbya sp. GB1-A1]|uniref:hypothetical protein n=1 Tax=Leptolyngbya sp. GB1-A1 TaxID=2933908 RepID=UPI003296EC86